MAGHVAGQRKCDQGEQSKRVVWRHGDGRDSRFGDGFLADNEIWRNCQSPSLEANFV